MEPRFDAGLPGFVRGQAGEHSSVVQMVFCLILKPVFPSGTAVGSQGEPWAACRIEQDRQELGQS